MTLRSFCTLTQAYIHIHPYSAVHRFIRALRGILFDLFSGLLLMVDLAALFVALQFFSRFRGAGISTSDCL
jgi:hypothetical protein